MRVPALVGAFFYAGDAAVIGEHRGRAGGRARERAGSGSRQAGRVRGGIFFFSLARPWILVFVLDRIALSVASRRGGDGDGDGVGGPEAESDVLGPARMGRRD